MLFIKAIEAAIEGTNPQPAPAIQDNRQHRIMAQTGSVQWVITEMAKLLAFGIQSAQSTANGTDPESLLVIECQCLDTIVNQASWVVLMINIMAKLAVFITI